MTLRGQFGLYTGGVVTKSGSNQIHISPYIINTSSIGVTGAGADGEGVGKVILLQFGQSTTSVYPERAATYSATYKLFPGSSGPGRAWLYFDEGTLDINISIDTPKPNGIVFAKLTWNSGTTNIAGINIDTSGVNRDESYVVSSTDPASPDHLISEGFRWNPGNKNRPFANFAVLSDVVQAETKLLIGSEYFLTFATPNDIVSSSLTVSIKPCQHIGRFSGNLFCNYNWSEHPDTPDYVYQYTFSNINLVQGQTIYIAINKTTGAPYIGTSFNSSTHSLIAQSSVDPSATNLNSQEFEIVNNLGGQVKLVDTISKTIKGYYAPGFIYPVVLEGIGSNKVLFKKNILVFDGYLKEIPDTEITFPESVNTGVRYDVCYINIWKESLPWTDLNYAFQVVTNFQCATYSDPFSQPGLITSGSGEYVYNSNGYYEALNSDRSVDGRDYAFCLGVVRRLNKSNYSLTNENGGVFRPDGRTHNTITSIELRAPYTVRKTSKNLLGNAVRKILKGDLNTRYMPSTTNSSIYDKEHIKIDRLGNTETVTGTTRIGSLDGIRTNWSNNYSREVTLFALFRVDLDSGSSPYNFPSITYSDSSKILIIKVPDGTSGQLLMNDFGIPIAELTWVGSGLPVEILGDWSVGDPRNSSARLDTDHVNYVSNGEIAVAFKVNYLQDPDIPSVGLTQVPSRIIDVSISGDSSVLQNRFAPGLTKYNNPTKIRDLEDSTVIEDVDYFDSLYLQRAGDTRKGHTFELHIVRAGNASTLTDYSFSNVYTEGSDNYTLGNLIEVIRLDTLARVPVSKFILDTGNVFKVRLGQSIANTIPLEFVFGSVGGHANKQLDIAINNLSIDNVTQASIQSITSDGSTSYIVSDGNIIYGVGSLNRNGLYKQHHCYVGKDYVPCTFEGLGTNRVVIKPLISADIYGTLTEPSNWTLSGIQYKPSSGSLIRYCVLKPYKNQSTEIYIRYLYNALPFIPFKPVSGRFVYEKSVTDDPIQVVDPGYIYMATDGTANDSQHISAPSERRFPTVDNVTIIGLDVDNNPPGLVSTVGNIAMIEDLFMEGSEVNFLSNYHFGVSVDAGSGLAALLSLVKQNNVLRLLVFEKRSGDLVLDNPENAFLVDLEGNPREVVIND